MMDIEQILEMWKKDSDIDEMNLDGASKDIAKMHSKYLDLLTFNKLKLKKKEAEYSLLLKDKWLYYNGKLSQAEMDAKGWEYDPFNGLTKPLKSDMDFYYNSDKHIIEAKAQIDYLKTVIDTLKEIMDTVKWRHQTVKNMIDWRKFTSGI